MRNIRDLPALMLHPKIKAAAVTGAILLVTAVGGVLVDAFATEALVVGAVGVVVPLVVGYLKRGYPSDASVAEAEAELQRHFEGASELD
jgi:hypothetical protein